MKLMESYQDKIVGAIRGLDRIRFRGTLRWLATRRGSNHRFSGPTRGLVQFPLNQHTWISNVTFDCGAFLLTEPPS